MAYSKAKLKRNGDGASPCFRPFLIGNAPDKCLPIRILLQLTTSQYSEISEDGEISEESDLLDDHMTFQTTLPY
jgi:hypothetical protein